VPCCRARAGECTAEQTKGFWYRYESGQPALNDSLTMVDVFQELDLLLLQVEDEPRAAGSKGTDDPGVTSGAGAPPSPPDQPAGHGRGVTFVGDSVMGQVAWGSECSWLRRGWSTAGRALELRYRDREQCRPAEMLGVDTGDWHYGIKVVHRRSASLPCRLRRPLTPGRRPARC
jgi:hypothetical protein